MLKVPLSHVFLISLLHVNPITLEDSPIAQICHTGDNSRDLCNDTISNHYSSLKSFCDENRAIHLNISWFDMNKLESISVKTENESGECDSLETYRSKQASGFIVVPDLEVLNPEYALIGGGSCRYYVKFINNSSDLDTEHFHFTDSCGISSTYSNSFNLSPSSSSSTSPSTSPSSGISNISHDQPAVKNILVTSLYEPNGIIRFNISWEEIETPNHDQLTIEINNVNCTDFHFVEDDQKNYVIEPGLIFTNHLYKAHPGCEYEIEFRSHHGTIHKRTTCTYHVPECVGPLCSCPTYNPTPKIRELTYERDRHWLVRWDPGPASINGSNQTITSFDDCEADPASNSTSLEPIICTIEDVNLSENWGRIELSYGEFLDNHTFKGRFTNNFGCSEEASFEFPSSRKLVDYIKYLISVVVLLTLGCIIWRWRMLYRSKEVVLKIVPKRFRRPFGPPVPSVASFHDPPSSVPMRINIQYTPMEFQNGEFDEYEFPRNKVALKEEIGRGAFGLVYSAKAYGIEESEPFTMVAVKVLGEHVTNENLDDFVAEIAIFKKIGRHPNIVKLLKCCTAEQPFMMIMEFVPCGDLKHYLVELRQQWLKRRKPQKFFPDNSDGAYIVPDPESPTSPNSPGSSQFPTTPQTTLTNLEGQTPLLAEYALEKILDHEELQRFALQIALGMAHLEKIPITHRDLAARNILINERKELKISDFGLSRQGPYVNHKVKKLPLRWMALEAIIDQKYDCKSDVWSFGVVLWEIATLGAFPYEEVPDSFVLDFLRMGKRLQRPEICTDSLFLMMLQCWAEKPEERPTFRELTEVLAEQKRRVYVDFGQLNPSYVFPPSDRPNLDKICMTCTLGDIYE